jgi:hypothetical protein
MFVQLTNCAYLYIKICCLLQITVSPMAVINTIFIKRKWKLNTIYRFETNVYFPTNKKQCLAKNCRHRMFFLNMTRIMISWAQNGEATPLTSGLVCSSQSSAVPSPSKPSHCHSEWTDTPSPWIPALSFAEAADPRRDWRKSTKHLDQYI